MLGELYEENGDESASAPEDVPEARPPADEPADQPAEEAADETAEDELWASPRPGEDELAAVLSAAVSSAENPQPVPEEPARDRDAVVADVAPDDPPPVRLRPRDRGAELPPSLVHSPVGAEEATLPEPAPWDDYEADDAVPGLAPYPDAETDDEPYQAVPGLAPSLDTGTEDEPELDVEPSAEPTLPVEVPRPTEELPTARLHAVEEEATAEVPLESGAAWQRSDDDVLPGRRAGSGLRLRHGLTRSGPRLLHRPRRRR